MKVYTLTIVYNDKTEEIEYLQEEISVEEGSNTEELPQTEDNGFVDGSHIIGEA